jgi:hypothetical protein
MVDLTATYDEDSVISLYFPLSYWTIDSACTFFIGTTLQRFIEIFLIRSN